MATAMTLYSRFQLDYPSFVHVDVPSPGYAETVSTSRVSSWLDNMSAYFTAHSSPPSAVGHGSQQTVVGAASQVTMSQVPSVFEPDSSSGETLSDSAFPRAPGGLPVDKEGKETRKAMLERRRKECEADEVSIAMAPVMKIPTSYMFYPDQYKRFRAMFPRVTPDPGLSFAHHDHPVAHTATLVGIRFIQQMLKPGSLALDIYGNPNGNEAYNRFQSSRIRKRPGLPKPARIETMVNLNVSADAVRMHNKWGDQWADDGSPRFVVDHHDNIPEDSFDYFLAVHTLYYLSMREITLLLQKNKRSKVIALVNYSPEQSGTLYGELKFSKSGGITSQTSPNGETYRHPDVDQWFQTNDFKFCPEPGNDYSSVGISWTSRCIGGPLYVIEIVHCPRELTTHTPYNPPQAPTLRVAGSCYMAIVRIGGVDVQLRVTNHALAEELRHFMVMRDRSDPETFAALGVKARRVTAPDLVTHVRQYDVNVAELQDHIVYAYLVDAPGELELLEGVKLLHGELLIPHAEALKFQGPGKFQTIWQALVTVMGVKRYHPKPALKGTKSKHVTEPHANSGGLLAVCRT